MRKRASHFATLCALSLMGCSGMPPGQPANAQTEQSTSDGWHPSERIVSRTLYDGKLLQYRTGHTNSGLEYRIYSDGAASVSRPSDRTTNSDWKLACRFDAMNDKRDCEIVANRSPLLIDYRFSEQPSLVCLQGHDFPGTTALIRLDDGKPISTAENGCVQASRLFPDILHAKKVSTRKVHWPYRRHIDETGDLIGLAEAVDLMKYFRANLQRK